MGQKLSVQESNSLQREVFWQSIDHEGTVWFEATIRSEDAHLIEASDEAVGEKLQLLFDHIHRIHPNFLYESKTKKLTTTLEFPRLWGLGTSSTLVHLLAQWAKIDAFALQFAVFGGSGYDIACAGANQALFFQKSEREIQVKEAIYKPPFLYQLYLVYLGKKQNSRSGIQHYRSQSKNRAQIVETINELTQQFYAAPTLSILENTIIEHENFIADIINLPKAKDLYFSDYWGQIKSLGAWGGDFVLVTSDRSEIETMAYFEGKGKGVCLSYRELVLI